MIAYGCLPTLLNKMTNIKTNYLKNLESLQIAYSNCYGDCVGDIKVLKLSLLIAMFESGDMFEKIGKKLEKNFLLDIDRDVDYSEWSKPETWYAMKTKPIRNSSSLNYESLCMEEKASLANRLADMLPPEPETATDNIKKGKDLNITESITYAERVKFRETINNLNNENVINTILLDYAIDKAMKRLCAALYNISTFIENINKNTKYYVSLYNTQLFEYNNTIGNAVSNKYKEWKNRFCEEQITEDSIKEHVEKAIVELLKAEVFDNIEANTKRKKYAEFKEEIDFDDYDIPKKKRPYELYARFRSFYALKKERTSLMKKTQGDFFLS